MPTFSRVSHISFSVCDVEASARWWAELLELTEIDRVVGDGWHGVLLMQIILSSFGAFYSVLFFVYYART